VTRTLPEGWALTKVSDISTMVTKGTTPTTHGFAYQDSGVRFVKVESLANHRIAHERCVYIGNDAHQALKRSQLSPGDVLISIAGTLGRVAVVQDQDVPANTNQAVALIRLTGEPHPEYVAHALDSSVAKKAVEEGGRGVGLQNLNLGQVSGLPVVFAPVPEQERIVKALDSYFSRLDDAVATLERVQRNLKRYRASVLKAAVEGRLVPTEAELARTEGRDYEPADVLLARILKERKARWLGREAEKRRAKAEAKATKAAKSWTKGDEEAALAKARAVAAKKYKAPASPDTSALPELPEGWCWVTVDQLTSDEPWSLTDGPFGSNLKTAHYTDAGPRVVRLQNIGDGEFKDAEAHISEEHYNSLLKHAVHAGDLVVSSLGEELPRACAVPDSLGPAIVKADCIRFAPDVQLSAARFVMHALNSTPTRRRTEKLVHGVGRPRIGLTLLRRVPLPLPPLAEQRRIANEIDRTLSVATHACDEVAAQNDRVGRLRQSILKWAFGGKLVDQDPNDEPASVLLERIKAERENAQAAAKAKNKAGRTKRKKKPA